MITVVDAAAGSMDCSGTATCGGSQAAVLTGLSQYGYHPATCRAVVRDEQLGPFSVIASTRAVCRRFRMDGAPCDEPAGSS